MSADDLRRRLEKLEQQAELSQPRDIPGIVIVRTREQAEKFREVQANRDRYTFIPPEGVKPSKFLTFEQFEAGLVPREPDDEGPI